MFLSLQAAAVVPGCSLVCLNSDSEPDQCEDVTDWSTDDDEALDVRAEMAKPLKRRRVDCAGRNALNPSGHVLLPDDSFLRSEVRGITAMEGDSTNHPSAPRGEMARRSLEATAMDNESTTSSLVPHGELKHSVRGHGQSVSEAYHDDVKEVSVFQPGGAALEFSIFEGDRIEVLKGKIAARLSMNLDR